MKDHGRGDDVTNVVYPGASHVFLVREFLPPAMLGIGGVYDFGGTPEADTVAGKDAWGRITSGGCVELHQLPREPGWFGLRWVQLPGTRMAFGGLDRPCGSRMTS